MSAEESSDRLTQMMQDTVDATGLIDLEMIEDREFRACSAPLLPGKEYDDWGIHFPSVGENEARVLMREIHDYWTREAPDWSQEGFEVIDDGIDFKGTPAVFLDIDGFSLGATYFPDADTAAFLFGGSAPCVDRPDGS